MTRGQLWVAAVPLLLAAALAGSGCATGAVVKVHHTTEGKRLRLPQKPARMCPVMRTVIPKGDLVIVARLRFHDGSGLTAEGREGVERQLMGAACQAGAEGVIIEREAYRVPWVGTDVVAVAVLVKKPETTRPNAAIGPRERLGTCFAVDRAGHLATAEHVIRGALKLSVQFEGGVRIPARVLMSKPDVDVAILAIATPTPNYLELSSAARSSPGDRVFTFGFPVVELLGEEPKFTDGTVSALSGIGGDRRVLQMSIPVQPGNSGGPVVTEQGTAIGIVTSSASAFAFFHTTGALPQGVNWAVKSDEAIAMLNVSRPAGEPLERDAAIKRARRAVCAVTALTNTPL